MSRHEVEHRVNLIFENGDVLRLWDMDRDGARRAQRVSTKMLCLERRT